MRRETKGILQEQMEEIFKAEGRSVVSCTVESQRERGLKALATKGSWDLTKEWDKYKWWSILWT